MARIENGSVIRLISSVRSRSSVNLAGVSEDFLKYYSKIDEAVSHGVADSSNNAYYLSFNRFAKFCVENNVPSLPSDPDVIITYFIKLSEEGRNVSPVLNARSAIRYYNLMQNPTVVPPTERDDVVRCVDGIRRKFGRPVKKREPMTMEIFRKIVDNQLKGDHLLNSNFKQPIGNWQVVAKTCLKLFTFARYEEAIDLKKSQFIFTSEGDCIVDFQKGKMNQFRNANEAVITPNVNDLYCPVLILKKYLYERINSSLDHYFLPKVFNGNVYLLEPAPYRYSLDKLNSVLKDIGVANWNDFGEHSDRSGGLSIVANAGCDYFSIQAQGRMASEKTPKMYHKRSLNLRRKVSNILNSK